MDNLINKTNYMPWSNVKSSRIYANIAGYFFLNSLYSDVHWFKVVIPFLLNCFKSLWTYSSIFSCLYSFLTTSLTKESKVHFVPAIDCGENPILSCSFSFSPGNTTIYSLIRQVSYFFLILAWHCDENTIPFCCCCIVEVKKLRTVWL